MAFYPRHELNLILDAKHHDAFNYLGLHQHDPIKVHSDHDKSNVGKKLKPNIESVNTITYVFRTFLPYAQSVNLKIGANWEALERVHEAGLYEWQGTLSPQYPCLLQIETDSRVQEVADTYSLCRCASGCFNCQTLALLFYAARRRGSVIFHPVSVIDEAVGAQVQATLRQRILRAFVGRGQLERVQRFIMKME